MLMYVSEVDSTEKGLRTYLNTDLLPVLANLKS